MYTTGSEPPCSPEDGAERHPGGSRFPVSIGQVVLLINLEANPLAQKEDRGEQVKGVPVPSSCLLLWLDPLGWAPSAI